MTDPSAIANSSIIETVIVITLFGLIASLSVDLSKKLKLPHSIFLVLIGIVLGTVATTFYDPSSITVTAEIFSSIEHFNLSAITIFFIFLPTLIFESSYNINTRELMKDLPSILVLAVPALLISILLVALGLHFIAGIDFIIALLIGAIISATDPVAVVAIFKDLGAPKRLNLLVEGESLFNDATSIVAFSIILSIIESSTQINSFGANTLFVIFEFLKTFLGGILTGLIVAYTLTNFLKLIDSNPVIEILVTTLIAYLSFLIAHHYLEVSGVMSTVTAGLYISGFGRTSISYSSREFLGNFWETIAFLINSVLFLSIGLLMSHYLSISVLIEYLPILITAIVAVNISRAFSVHTMMPLLARTKLIEPIAFSYQTLLWWGGGLRGAIAIALSLSLIGSPFLTLEMQETILFITFGVVMFSLLANALTIEPIIRFFGLDKLSRDEVYTRELSMVHAKRSVIEKIVSLKALKRYYPKPYHKILNHYKEEEKHLLESLESFSDLTNENKKTILIREALHIEKNHYFKLFSEGELSSLSMKDLQLEVDKEIDRLKINAPLFTDRLQLGRASYLERVITVFEKLNHTYTTHTLTMRFEKARATIKAMQEVARFLSEKEAEYHDLHLTCSQILSEFLDLKKQSETELSQISLNFPEYVDKVVETIIERSSIRSEIAEIKRMYSLEQIPDGAYTHLIKNLKQSINNLDKEPVKIIELTPMILLKRVPFFKDLDEKHLKALSKHLEPITFLKDDLLIKENSKGHEMFFITRGVILVYQGDRDEKTENYKTLATLKSGDILGEMSLLSHKHTNASAKAISHGSALTLKKSHFEAFLNDNPQVEEKINEVSLERTEEDKKL